ncbi:unnamed protein product [Rotaria magnacalcarata]|uniref:Uncharacterized protein n=1 Tax=Rotaria magnacalcarata TaxID=392030 RepID=A0A816N3K5_9BILA|nr:unnamed protein product [Rotaria magnacalcarata]CAF2086975.1 unnamed protein product [Rotaria magnacalcarata]
MGLFYDQHKSLRFESLTFSNQRVTCLTQRFFDDITMNICRCLFGCAKHLTIIDCPSQNISSICRYISIMNQLEHLHIILRQPHIKSDTDVYLTVDKPVNKLLFDKKTIFFKTALVGVGDGLILSKSLIPHENVRNINLTLQTIDDLYIYILLDGLVPSVEKMTIHLRQRIILSK